jgi:tetratricopeptide (TPR) repeat protein
LIRVLLALLALMISAGAAEISSDFENANRLYEKGDYAAASAAYQKAAEQGRVSAALLFNLGNAAFKNGQPGRAIAAYRKAQALAPRDPDIRANLRFARESVPGNTSRMSVGERLARIFTLREAAVISTALVWVWFGLLATGQMRPQWKNQLRLWQTAAGVFAVVFAGYYWANCFYQLSHASVVVTAAGSSAVRFGPLEESQTSYSVRDGNELRIVGRKDAWVQVSDASGRVGWIAARDVEPVPF